MRRILIIGVILVGAWFVFQEINAPKEEAVNTDETVAESVSAEASDSEKSSPDATPDKEEKRNPIDRAGLTKTTIVSTTTTVLVPSAIEEKTFESSETPVMHVTDTVKVFLYEWGIDLSTANVEAGNIEFQVFNNGQFTHYFGIEGVNYGKIVPGELAVFTVSLDAGELTISSPRQIDMANEMQETLYVQ